MNLVIARITPFKNIFFTTGHSLFFACVLSLILKAHNFSDVAAIIGSRNYRWWIITWLLLRSIASIMSALHA